MKITKQQLKQLIEEELAETLDLEERLESDIPEIPGESFQLAVVKKLDEIMTAVNNLTAVIKH